MPTGRLAHQDLMVMLLCRLAWKGCSSGTRGMRSASLLQTLSVWNHLFYREVIGCFRPMSCHTWAGLAWDNPF